MTTDPATLTGAYAVNALTGQERADFELHLATCDDCRQEVGELREAAARLGAAADAAPPPALKHRVLAEIVQTRQDPPLPGREPQPARDNLSARSRWGMRVAVAAAAAGVALAGALGSVALRGQQELGQLRQGMAQANVRDIAIAEVLQAPDARMVSTVGAGGMRGTTVVSERRGMTMFVGAGLSSPPANRAYQLWFISGSGRTTSAGLLRGDAAGHTAPLVAPMPADTAYMGITVEPLGGSPAPTTDPIMSLALPK